MKKLMIAAAAAAMIGGAYADDLCNEEITAADGCSVYNVKFKFKTLTGKDANCSEAQLGACGFANPIAYLDNATRTFDGILWQCNAACFEGVNPNSSEGASINYVLWEKKSEKAISPTAIFTDSGNGTGTWSANAATEEAQFEILGRYGKTAQNVAAYWTPSMLDPNSAGELITAAGFGTFDNKNLRIKKISGNAVAKLEPMQHSRKETCGTVGYDAVYAFMCHDFQGWCCCDCIGAALAPASGTWSIKYNSSLSKGTKPLSRVIPAYAYDKQ